MSGGPELVDLLIEVPGLPVKVGRFRRVGIFDLELAERVTWVAESSGHSNITWVGPTDWSWRYPGILAVPRWGVGSIITIMPGNLTVRVSTKFELPVGIDPPVVT